MLRGSLENERSDTEEKISCQKYIYHTLDKQNQFISK